MSYDFSGLDEDALRRQLSDCGRPVGSGSSQRRSARGFSYEEIHDITKIDVWFIDKLAILVEMEQALAEPAADCGASAEKQNASSSRIMLSRA